jgi:hypothetical protein
MIIWIASYPKSGNTWLRSLVSSLIYTEEGAFNFKLLEKISLFPKRTHLKSFTNKFNNFEEIQKYWILAQEKINLNKKINIFKTHQLNCNINNFEFTNKNNTIGTIYIVRDPRNIAVSISNHYSLSFEESKKFLVTPRLIGTKPNDDKDNNVVNLIGTWGEHYNFWTKNPMLKDNLLLLRYEDLISDIEQQVDKIANFLKKYIPVSLDKNKIKKIIETTSFEKLKKMEDHQTFKEGVFNNYNTKKVKFFFKGPENNWKKTLKNDLVQEIEMKFQSEMKELRYLNDD